MFAMKYPPDQLNDPALSILRPFSVSGPNAQGSMRSLCGGLVPRVCVLLATERMFTLGVYVEASIERPWESKGFDSCARTQGSGWSAFVRLWKAISRSNVPLLRSCDARISLVPLEVR